MILMFVSLIAAGVACALPDLTSISPQSITGSGNVITQEEAISDFDKVDISSAFDVTINQGEAYKVVIRVDDNIVEHLRVEKAGSTLKIGLKPNVSKVSNATLEAEISMPELTGIDLSGASDANITGFKLSESLTVDLSGSSSLKGESRETKGSTRNTCPISFLCIHAFSHLRFRAYTLLRPPFSILPPPFLRILPFACSVEKGCRNTDFFIHLTHISSEFHFYRTQFRLNTLN